jgi:hypothetical protein
MRRSYADAWIGVSDCSTTPQIVVRSSCVHARRLPSYDVTDKYRSAPVVFAHRGLLSGGRDGVDGVQLQLCSRMAVSLRCSVCRCRPVSSSCARARRVSFRGWSAVTRAQLQLCSRIAVSFPGSVRRMSAGQLQLCSRMAGSFPARCAGCRLVSSSCVRASRSPFRWSGRCRAGSAPVVFAHGAPPSMCFGRFGSGGQGRRSAAQGEDAGCMPVPWRPHDRPPTSRASWPVHAARLRRGAGRGTAISGRRNTVSIDSRLWQGYMRKG